MEFRGLLARPRFAHRQGVLCLLGIRAERFLTDDAWIVHLSSTALTVLHGAISPLDETGGNRNSASTLSRNSENTMASLADQKRALMRSSSAPHSPLSSFSIPTLLSN